MSSLRGGRTDGPETTIGVVSDVSSIRPKLIAHEGFDLSFRNSVAAFEYDHRRMLRRDGRLHLIEPEIESTKGLGATWDEEEDRHWRSWAVFDPRPPRGYIAWAEFERTA